MAKKTKRNTRFLPDTIISLIIVTCNDEEIIRDRLNTLNKAISAFKTNYEILVVDNASQDKTVEEIRKLYRRIPHLRILVLSKRYDTEIALTAGLDTCVGDYTLLFNIHTDPPAMIPALMDKLLEGYDIVIGKNTQDVLNRNSLSKAFLNLVNKLSTHEHRPSYNYLVGLNRKAINAITRTRRKSRSFGYISSLIGLRSYSVEYKPLKKFRNRIKRESLLELFFKTVDTIISNSFKPMRILSFLGMLASVLFLLYILAIVILEVFFKMDLAPKGWISIGTVIGAMFFLLFSLLTLISEYLIRVVNETRNEPLYFIDSELDRSVILPERDRLNIA